MSFYEHGTEFAVSILVGNFLIQLPVHNTVLLVTFAQNCEEKRVRRRRLEIQIRQF